MHLLSLHEFANDAILFGVAKGFCPLAEREESKVKYKYKWKPILLHSFLPSTLPSPQHFRTETAPEHLIEINGRGI